MRQLKIKQLPIDNNRMQEIENYLSAIGHIDAMPCEKVIAALVERVKEGNISATRKFTNAYLNIAINTARHYCKITDLPFKELVDKGIDGYVAGVRQSKGNTGKNLAQAEWWIRESMLAAICERYSALSYLKTKTLKTEPVTNRLRSEFFEKIYQRLKDLDYDLVPYKTEGFLITQIERNNIWQQAFSGYRFIGNDLSYYYSNSPQISIHDWHDLYFRLYRNGTETDRIMNIMNRKKEFLSDVPDHRWFSSLTLINPFDLNEMWVFCDIKYNDKFAADMEGITDQVMNEFENYIAAWKETILEMSMQN